MAGDKSGCQSTRGYSRKITTWVLSEALEAKQAVNGLGEC